VAIAFKTEFTLEEQPEVPFKLRMKVDSALAHGRAVSVVCPKGPHNTKQRTLNTFPLTSGAGPRPRETTEEVAQAIADIMQAESLRLLAAGSHEQVAEGLECSIKVAKFGAHNAVTWKWVWKLETVEEDPQDVFDDPALEEGSHQYLHGIVGTLQNIIDRQAVDNQALLQLIRDMADRTQKPLELVGAQLGFAQMLTMQGMQAMVTALHTTWSHEQAKEAEVQKTQRFDKLLEAAGQHLGPAVGMGLSQLMITLKRKMNGESGFAPRGSGYEAHQQQTRNHQASAQAAQPPEVDDEMMADPLLSMTQAFAMSLTPGQRRMLRRRFSAEALDAFDDMLESESGAQVRERFTVLRSMFEGNNLGPLLDAVGDLEEDQQQLAMAVVSAALHDSKADE